jgi:uncharacterized protein
MLSSRKFRIFSCDGGGFRGYLTSLIVEKIEEELNSAIVTNRVEPSLKFGDYFDMYAGTSTGALIACGLAFGMSAQEVRELYENSGKAIFPDINWGKEIRYRLAQVLSIFTLNGLGRMTSEHRFKLSRPLFDGTELKSSIEGIFKDACLGDLSKSNKRILVTAYDCWNSLPVVFDSHNEQHRSLKVVDVLLASSAYPGGFPSHAIPGKGIHNKTTEPGHSLPANDKALPLVDGGLIANNPALLALLEYCEKRKSDDQIPKSVIMASFGTGRLVLRFNNGQTSKMGQLDWSFPFGNPLLEVVYGGYSRIIDRAASLLVRDCNDGNEDNYFRFQPYILSELGKARCPSPDTVLIKPEQQKDFEVATFQYRSKDVLEHIFKTYLQDKQLEVDFDGSSNLELQVSQRIKKLISSLSESNIEGSQNAFMSAKIGDSVALSS